MFLHCDISDGFYLSWLGLCCRSCMSLLQLRVRQSHQLWHTQLQMVQRVPTDFTQNRHLLADTVIKVTRDRNPLFPPAIQGNNDKERGPVGAWGYRVVSLNTAPGKCLLTRVLLLCAVRAWVQSWVPHLLYVPWIQQVQWLMLAFT